MSDNPQTDLHISKSLDEAKSRLEQMMVKKAAEESTETPPVPPERATAAWSVAERLARRFGYGTDRQIRARFYKRLEELVDLHGDPVLRIISDCVWGAERANNKQRWFCKSVSLRLKENGFGLDETNHNW